ncbi:LysR family transcriptional regulator [Streptomyces sp. UNOC14_S4]|uniref:LysR substrate-binding domain-containing protein n=1 Tax=Streptomyces sp. UNOC14_S4 TaxID=2872340 RepID=UPI001E4BA728|nr:LysR family transcriptional regulator [Streptomyces sp. UNOC14_S4]MCC3770191.1 LysR family transcriptional regulator [Streptomyces sp. UNOC14_S4]
MEIRQVRYFVVVAEELHFGRAAERLHIVQSAVSQQVRRLERELGVELFDRSPRHVRLTGAGARFLPAARELLVAEERARAAVAGFAGRAARALRLGTSAGLGAHLDRLLDVFAATAPDVPVELVSAPARQRTEMVASGDLDAAFVRGGMTAPGLRVVPVWRDPLVAVLPSAHPLADAPDVALADLAALPLRLPPRRDIPALVDLVVTACHDAGFEPVPGPLSHTLQDTLAGIGSGEPTWTVAYAAHADQLRTTRVAFLPFRGSGLRLPTGLAVRPEVMSPELSLLVEACRPAGDDLRP